MVSHLSGSMQQFHNLLPRFYYDTVVATQQRSYWHCLPLLLAVGQLSQKSKTAAIFGGTNNNVNVLFQKQHLRL